MCAPPHRVVASPYVPRPHLDEVPKPLELAQGTEQTTRALLSLDGEVRVCQVAYKERVSGHENPGLFAPAGIL